jgi:hypothetical protein
MDPVQPPGAVDSEEQRIVNGARVLGAVVGGTAGQHLWNGLEDTGLIRCSPFDLQACQSDITPAALSPATRVSSVDSMDFPFADVLRNPTSILPQDWNLSGRKYLGDLPAQPAAQAPLPAAQPPLPAAQPPAPLLNTAPNIEAPPASIAAPLETAEEQMARLQEQLLRLKELKEQLSAAPPVGVPPASAGDVPAGVLPAWPVGAPVDEPLAGIMADGLPGYDGAAAALFSAVADADGGSGGSTLLATAVSAALGALACEYVATNREPPFPDPLMSGLYAPVHGAVRAASRSVGGAMERLVGIVAQRFQR